MNKIMIIAGGIINLLIGFFHCGFWYLWDWSTTTSCLPAAGRSSLYILNIHVAFTAFAFAYLSLFHYKDLIKAKIGKVVLAIISIFYIVRAIDQFIFYYFDKAFLIPSILFSIFLIIIALLYIIPLYTGRNSK